MPRIIKPLSGNWCGLPAPAPVGHTAYNHVGDFAGTTYSLVKLAAVGAGAFHGYRRNKSIGWAIAWALLAGLSPIITTGVAVAQGFGQPKRS